MAQLIADLARMERGVTQAKRTVAVLSEAYPADHTADFESIMAQSKGTFRKAPTACCR